MGFACSAEGMRFLTGRPEEPCASMWICCWEAGVDDSDDEEGDSGRLNGCVRREGEIDRARRSEDPSIPRERSGYSVGGS